MFSFCMAKFSVFFSLRMEEIFPCLHATIMTFPFFLHDMNEKRFLLFLSLCLFKKKTNIMAFMMYCNNDIHCLFIMLYAYNMLYAWNVIQPEIMCREGKNTHTHTYVTLIYFKIVINFTLISMRHVIYNKNPNPLWFERAITRHTFI